MTVHRNQFFFWVPLLIGAILLMAGCAGNDTQADRNAAALGCLSREAEHYPPLEAVAAEALEAVDHKPATRISHCEQSQVDALGSVQVVVPKWTTVAQGTRRLEGLGWTPGDSPFLVSPNGDVLASFQESGPQSSLVISVDFELAEVRDDLFGG